MAILALAIGLGVIAVVVLSPVTRPGPIPTHIETWAYDDGCGGGMGVSPSLVRQWVTYAESNCGPTSTKAIRDCHASGVTYCTTVQYLDANKIYRDGSVPIAQAAQENWWLHLRGYSDEAHRVVLAGYGGGYQLNQENPAVDAWFQNYVRTNYNADDALMMDDTGAGVQGQFGGVAVQEIRTDAQLQAAHQQLANAMTHQNRTPFLQIDNGIQANPFLTSSTALLNHPAAVRGLIDEGEPENDGQMPNSTWGYPTLLDEIAYTDHTANDFEVLLSYGSNGSVQPRRVQAATVLLGYSPGHIVSWSNLEQDNPDLAIWPEEGIVPTDPLQSMSKPGGSHCLDGTGAVCTSGGHNDLQVAPGVYRREFGECYNQGAKFGRCAAIVNTTGSPVTVQKAWLTRSYAKEITLRGGDVQSGGTVDISGASFTAGSTTLGAQDAMLLADPARR